MTTARQANPSLLVSRTRPASVTEDLLARLGPGGFAWLQDGAGMVTSGVATRIPVPAGRRRLARASATTAAMLDAIAVDDPLRLPGTGPIAVGALPFRDDADGELVIPATVLGRTRGGQGWITHTGPAGAIANEDPRPPVGRPPSRFDIDTHGGREAWGALVANALARISGGGLAKVVLARRVTVDADESLDVATVLRRLRMTHPSCFVFAVDGFLGATPELLVRRRGRRVLSHPMAGTAGPASGADDAVATGLATSAKDLDEHRLVVEAVREALAPVCTQLVAGAQPEVVRLATVTHLATTVAGQLLPPPPSSLALAGRLHPTPAVGGTPRAEALAAIADLEDFDRGLYAGPVGWMDSRGDGDWAVALRCAQLDGNRAELTAGAGIVADSNSGEEWVETELKLQPMLEALVSS